jgi:hypothetical protein
MPRRRCPPAARLVGTYTAPGLRVGDREHCLFRDVLCKVTSFTEAPIDWPRGVPVGMRSAPALVVTEELAWALRSESAKAVRWHWGAICRRGLVLSQGVRRDPDDQPAQPRADRREQRERRRRLSSCEVRG